MSHRSATGLTANAEPNLTMFIWTTLAGVGLMRWPTPPQSWADWATVLQFLLALLTAIVLASWWWRNRPRLECVAFFRYNPEVNEREIKLACTAFGRHGVSIRSIRLVRMKNINNLSFLIVKRTSSPISEELATAKYVPTGNEIGLGHSRVIVIPLDEQLHGDARSGSLAFRVVSNAGTQLVPLRSTESGSLNRQAQL
jgi:hypothetical protein